MEARVDGLFQTGVRGMAPHTVSISHPFDLVIGSGTYLDWGGGAGGGEADRLSQLLVSYWTKIESWVNSPGYGDRVVDFSRPVLPRCLECHASYFQPAADLTARIDIERRATRLV